MNELSRTQRRAGGPLIGVAVTEDGKIDAILIKEGTKGITNTLSLRFMEPALVAAVERPEEG